ncbi:MAG: MFS transporter [Haloarculaceae archaeon]
MSREGVPWRSATVWLTVAVAMVAPLDMAPMGPTLPVVASAFGVSSARAGLVITAYALPGVVAAPLIGVFADRYGRQRVLVPCLVGFGLAGVAITLAPSFRALLALRVVQGCLGGSIFASLAYTLVGDVYEGTTRNAVMGVATAAVGLTAAAGPALGGALADVSWRAPFALYGLCVVVGLAVLVGLDAPAPAEADADDGSYLREAVAVLPLSRIGAVYGLTFLGYTFFFGGVLAGIPFLLADTYGLSASRIGILITLASGVTVLVSMLNGRFAHYLTNEGMLVTSFLAYGAGLALVWLSGSPMGVVAGLVVFGVGHGVFQPSMAASLSSIGPERFRGGILSLRTSVVLAAGAAGPPAFTLPASAIGYPVLYLAAGVVALLAGVAGVAVADVRR